jgi:hypothetical protein
MRTIVVTGMWNGAWERYGRQFAESFAANWPAEVELVIYTDRTSFALPRGEIRPLQAIRDYNKFMSVHSANPVACGRQETPHAPWKEKDRRRGYSWSHDAVKWAPQGIIPDEAAKLIEGDAILCWLDADVITTAPVPANWLDNLIGEFDGAYLGRVNSHSEIGFWAVRMSDAARLLTRRFATAYLSGQFLSFRQSHSAYIWDVARRGLPELVLRDLTPGGVDHVFATSPLSPFLTHRKGALKAAA